MEMMILVNESDERMGLEEKITTHRKGFLHRAFSIFIFNPKGELLIQKRAENKYHSGGEWANSCCGHPRDKEEICAAGFRRQKEELGIDVSLKKGPYIIYNEPLKNGMIEHELVHFLYAKSKKEPVFSLNKEEVSEINWISLETLRTYTEKKSLPISPWLRVYLERHFLLLQDMKDKALL